jgi:hypothetical protein
VFHFRHHRFLRHRQDIGFFGLSAIIAFYGIGQDIGPDSYRDWFFAIIAFYSIGRILGGLKISLLLLDPFFIFSIGQDLNTYILVFKN